MSRFSISHHSPSSFLILTSKNLQTKFGKRAFISSDNFFLREKVVVAIFNEWF